MDVGNGSRKGIGCVVWFWGFLEVKDYLYAAFHGFLVGACSSCYCGFDLVWGVKMHRYVLLGKTERYDTLCFGYRHCGGCVSGKIQGFHLGFVGSELVDYCKEPVVE